MELKPQMASSAPPKAPLFFSVWSISPGSQETSIAVLALLSPSPYYLARARMSPSPDPVEAIVVSSDLGGGRWDLGLSGLVWRI